MWFERASDPSNVELIICLDADDVDSIEVATHLQATSTFRCSVVQQHELPGNCVKGWNKAAYESTGQVLIAIADDFSPPEAWDTKLLNLQPPGWNNMERVVHVSDGYNTDIFTLAIVTRKRYERFGYLFFPGYWSLFSDTELTATAIRDCVVVDGTSLVFEHLHPDCGKRDRDAVDLNHASTERWRQGETMFNLRRQLGFPTENRGYGYVERIKYIAYIQATKDDFCLLEVCNRLLDEGVTAFFFCCPTHYWSGDKVSTSDGEQVVQIVNSLEREGAEVYTEVVDPANHGLGKPGVSRIDIETSVRNAALQHIHEKGFDHVIIVDGDELWLRGGLGALDTFVRRMAPNAVACRMVPVIGLPGYPVEGATDAAVVYAHLPTNFTVCRGINDCLQMDDRLIIHFTGTRRTMEETIAKHRQSGHYDDSDYDFEGWIKNTLPNIRPGMKNAHMYRLYQIWPSVRNWTMDELDHVPCSLRPYIGTRFVSEVGPPEFSGSAKELMTVLSHCHENVPS